MPLSEQEEFELLSLERDRALNQQRQQPTTAPREAPGSRPLDYGDMMRTSALNTGRALLMGGPITGGLTAGAEGIRNLGHLTDRLAYNAGGKVTDTIADLSGRRSMVNPFGVEIPPEVAGGAGYVTNVGVQALPVILGASTSKAAAQPGIERFAEARMQSALKPSLDELKSGKAATAIRTMLDEGINVTPSGVGKLRGAINELNDEITQRIAASPATVDKNKAAGELFGLVKKFEKQVTPGNDVKAIESAWTEFLNHPLIQGDRIPVQLAQELKQGTYTILKWKYGEQGSAATEAQKTLARGLKEEIAAAVPEVGQLNARESQLLDALVMAERRSMLEGNKNIGGITWLATNPKAWVAFMADKSPAFQSILARMANANSGTLPTAIGGTAGAVYSAKKNRPNEQ